MAPYEPDAMPDLGKVNTNAILEVDESGALLYPVPDHIYSGGIDKNSSSGGLEGNKPGGIDFQALALQHTGFAKVLKKNGQIDFSEPESVRQLTLALAQTNHALTLSLPSDRLCPPIPNRFNYILFIKRLLDSSPPLTAIEYLDHDLADGHNNDSSTSTSTSNEKKIPSNSAAREALGIDIGTGASAIYPLLALRQFSNWKMLATEIDPMSLRFARQNVRQNGLDKRCRIIEAEGPFDALPASASASASDSLTRMDVSRTTINPDADENEDDDADIKKEDPQDDPYSHLPGPWLLPLATLSRHHRSLPNGLGRIDFTMTNPPFYTSAAALLDSARLKKRPPNSACTGVEVEMVCRGGEVAWVARLLAESAVLAGRAVRDVEEGPARKEGRRGEGGGGGGGGGVRPMTKAKTRQTSDNLTKNGNGKRQASVQVQWWTTMLGHLSSVAKVLELLKQRGCNNYVVAEFVQGTKTKRWAVAWSWEGWRVSGSMPRGGVGGGGGGGGGGVVFGVRAGIERALLPVSTHFAWTVSDSDATAPATASASGSKKTATSSQTRVKRQEIEQRRKVARIVDEVIEELDDPEENDHDDDNEVFNPNSPGVRWRWNVASSSGIGVCMQGDCWSRKARRAREREREMRSMRATRVTTTAEARTRVPGAGGAQGPPPGMKKHTSKPAAAKVKRGANSRHEDVDADGDQAMREDCLDYDDRDNKVAKVGTILEPDDEQQQQQQQEEQEEEDEEEEEQAEQQQPQLVFKITVITARGRAPARSADADKNDNDDDDTAFSSFPSSVAPAPINTAKADIGIEIEIEIAIHWLFGHDPILFESFCGWLKRKVRERV